MKRIDTATVDEDLFGTGRDGFTNGNPGLAVPPTQLDDSFFNNVQEELCRVVEGDGTTLDENNLNQADDAVQRAAVRGVVCSPTMDYVLRGLTFTLNGASLVTPLAAGEFVENGRRYVITAAKLTAAGEDSHTLTASRDTYFYIASEDPGAPSTPPNRETVYVVQSAVTNGASAPSTPAGTLLFAMVVSNGSGSTAVTYFNRGPHIVDEVGDGVYIRPQLGTGPAVASLAPTPASSGMDLGYETADSQEGYYNAIYTEEIRVRSTITSTQTYASTWTNTAVTTTTAGGTTNHVVGLDADDYPDGTTAIAELWAVGFDPSDPTDGYTSFLRVHVHKDGGTWDLDGSGLTPDWEEGAGAIAAGVTTAVDISSGDLRLVITGHGTDAMRWLIKRHFIVSGD